MKKYVQTPFLALFMGVSTLALLGDSTAFAQTRYGTPIPNHAPVVNPNAPFVNPRTAPAINRGAFPGRYKPNNRPKKYSGLMARLRDQRHIAYQMPAPHPGMGMFQQWINYEPEYTLHPGDQLDIVVSSAPELSRTLTVGPDGRVVMPMSKPIMAAGRTFTQVQNELSAELAKQLRDPTIAVTPRAYSPEQIYVGGQVGQPGTYTMPGRIGALEALMMAGGMRPTARARQVAVLRRAPNGGMMMRTVNIRNGLLNIREYDDNMQLRRGDIIFVPQSNIAEIGTWMQNFRNALPVDFNVSYQFGANNGGTTVVSP
jgi:polysaccharide export outer membrane protein